MVLPVVYVDLSRALEAELFEGGIEHGLTGMGQLVRKGEDRVDGGGDARLRADVLITGWGSDPLPEQLALEDRLRLVVHSAGTIRTLVPPALLTGGVRVSQASAGMAQSVAELALYLTLSRLRDLDRIDRAMAGAHDWSGADFGLGRTLAGATVGIIGASRVGRAYLKLVAAAGSEVLVYDPYLDEQDAKALGARLVTLETLLGQSTVVAMHAPVRPETRHMLDARTLALIPDGAVVINTARAALIDTEALLAEVGSGRLSAALDVFDEEPLPPDSEWWQLPNALLTPHLGARTWRSRRAQGAIVVAEVRRYLNGLDLRHEVRPDTYDLLA